MPDVATLNSLTVQRAEGGKDPVHIQVRARSRPGDGSARAQTGWSSQAQVEATVALPRERTPGRRRPGPPGDQSSATSLPCSVSTISTLGARPEFLSTDIPKGIRRSYTGTTWPRRLITPKSDLGPARNFRHATERQGLPGLASLQAHIPHRPVGKRHKIEPRPGQTRSWHP